MRMPKEKNELHFLVADDQQLMTRLVKGILRAGGFKRVVIATTGDQALFILRRYPVDFIIADWHMPSVGGIDLLRILREDARFCDIPFLMLSMEISHEKIAYAMEEGVDGYLAKPVTQDALLASIGKILETYADTDSMNFKLHRLHRLILRKRYDEAIKFAQHLLKGGAGAEVLLAISECFYKMQHYDSATEYAQSAINLKKNGKALGQLGKIHMAQNHYAEAVTYFKQSSEASPANLSRKIQIGDLYLKLGLKEEAEVVLASLDKTQITDINKVEMGAAYLSYGNVKKAKEYLEESLDPIPETVPVFNRFAIELRKIGELEKSLKLYEKCLKIEPDNFNLLFNSGVVYFQMKAYQKAKARLDKSLELKPDFRSARKLLDYLATVAG